MMAQVRENFFLAPPPLFKPSNEIYSNFSLDGKNRKISNCVVRGSIEESMEIKAE